MLATLFLLPCVTEAGLGMEEACRRAWRALVLGEGGVTTCSGVEAVEEVRVGRGPREEGR